MQDDERFDGHDYEYNENMMNKQVQQHLEEEEQREEQEHYEDEYEYAETGPARRGERSHHGISRRDGRDVGGRWEEKGYEDEEGDTDHARYTYDNRSQVSEDYPPTTPMMQGTSGGSGNPRQQQPTSEMSVSELQRLLNQSQLNAQRNAMNPALNRSASGHLYHVPPSPTPLSNSVRFQPVVPHDNHLEYTKQLLHGNDSNSTTPLLGPSAGFLHYHNSGNAKQHQFYGNEGIITRLCIAQGPLVKVSHITNLSFAVISFYALVVII